MYPTLQFGRLTMSSYTVLLDLGLLLGLGVLTWRARRRVARPGRWLDGALVALVAGVAGGRLGYVVAHAGYYDQHRDEILRFWLGGLSWHGVLAGALLVLPLYCRLRGLRFWRLADELALVAPLVGAGGWLGCLAAGCAYGRPLAGPDWLLADLPDVFGVWALRPNVQLVGAAWSLLLLPLLAVAGRARRPGMTAALFLALYGAGLAWLSSLRGDAIPLWAGRRLDVWLNGLVVMGGAIMMGLLAIRSRHL
jgi:phosphatidylglycerol---prolipoprotein diacylglyceryl transferase